MQALIAGGGIGGLAAALAATRAGWDVRLYERTSTFSEVGAGIQLGPNVVKVLHGWGLADALSAVAAFPDRLEVRSAVSGDTLGVLRLGDTIRQRYGAPHATVHRADLHGVLLEAARQALAQAQAAHAARDKKDALDLALRATVDADLARARSLEAVATAEVAQRKAEIADLQRQIGAEGGR